MLMQGQHPQRRHAVTESSAVGEARRDSLRLAVDCKLDEVAAGRLGIIVTELGNNLVRYAGGGEILLQRISTAAGEQVEVLAIDSGPGMADTQRCLTDGYSTGGTPGTGLGSVKRLSSSFDLYSSAGKGCAIMSRVGPGACDDFGAVCTAIAGEQVSGDDWRLAKQDGYLAVAVFDGLGHGPGAAEAANAATRAFASMPFAEPQQVMQRAHEKLQGTRGAAGACARRSSDGQLAFAGIGNISGRCTGTGKSQGLVSLNGIVGLQMRRVQQFSYQIDPQALLILHSDGMTARWDLEQHTGLQQRHPAIIAAVLYREHRRGRDDATVVVVGNE